MNIGKAVETMRMVLTTLFIIRAGNIGNILLKKYLLVWSGWLDSP